MTFYRRHLPHWQPEGSSALFITWRLYGSLPKTVIAEGGFAAWDRHLDQATSGPLWLSDPRVAQCVVDTLHYGERELKLYELHAWILMANHVHILIHPESELARITKAIKNYSARQANTILERTGQPFWQDESFDHWVRGPRELEKIVRYIERNPVTAGLVSSPEQWRWSSAYKE